jgi:hypothetical protein
MKHNNAINTAVIFFVLSSSFFTPDIQAQHIEEGYTDLQLKNNRYYSKKHKNQKKTAWILMGSGTALTVGGVIAQAATATVDLVTMMTGSEPEFNQTGSYVALAGIATMATSIPFFIASGNNKKRANIALQEQKITMGNKTNQQASYQSISLRIRLGK